MSKFVKMVTPAGVAIWPALGKANTKFNPEGVFEIKLRMDRNDPKVAAFIEKVTAERDNAVEHIRKEYEDKAAKATGSAKASAMAAIKRITAADSPIKPFYDEDGNETNEVTIAAKLKATFKRKDGTTGTHEFVPCVDAKKAPFDPREVNVGGGSVCKAQVSVYPYVVPSSMQAGIAVRLEAVQVIKLVTFGGGKADMFDEEDGDAITAAPKADSAVTEEVAEDGDF